MHNENVPLMSENAANVPPYNPPSYDTAIGNEHEYRPDNAKSQRSEGYKPIPPPEGPLPYSMPGPSMPYGETVAVYYYQNPLNGHVITSVFPPDHPEMICLQEGRHVTHARFGLLGILAAIVWFPIGIACCLIDRRVVCTRCGKIIDDGFSC